VHVSFYKKLFSKVKVVRMKEQPGMDKQRDGLYRIYCGEVALQKGIPAGELESTTTYRLGVYKGGGWKSPRKVTGWDNPQ
jgi:hypothetical protein